MKFKDTNFEIFGSKYSIKHVETIEPTSEGVFTEGRCNSSAKTIQIATKNIVGKTIDDSTYKIVLLHELFHAILDEGQYLQASADEPMVEWMARCIKSLVDQKII